MQSQYLLGVTCTSAADCWAVGSRFDTFGVNQTLIEHWDGSLWSVVPSPDSSTIQADTLQGVTCMSASDCWAVGFSSESETRFHTLVEHWDGNSWSVVPSPDANPTSRNILLGVKCTSASQCWAAGYQGYTTGGIPEQTLIERWDGVSWSVATSPNSSAEQQNLLQDVTCTATSECWAVGYYYLSYTQQQTQAHTLIEHYTVSPKIVSITRLPNGHIRLNCIGLPNSGYNVQASPDLNPANFATISNLTADPAGSFSFEDTNAVNFTTRFYRLTIP
jgi:hypothetical protein